MLYVLYTYVADACCVAVLLCCCVAVQPIGGLATEAQPTAVG